LPEIAVGRWPVSTPAEAAVVASKSMAYESGIRGKTHPGARRAVLVNVDGYVDARERLDRMGASLPAGWKLLRNYYTDQNPHYKTPPPDANHVLQELNDGVGLIVHVGHGSDKSWMGSISVTHLAKLKNADRLPVVFSVGCSTATFAPLPPYEAYVDIHGKAHKGTNAGEVFKSPPPPPSPYQKDAYNPTGLGELLVKKGPNGAVAYIGCNTGSQGCALTLLEGFMRGYRQAAAPRIGDCWTSAIRYYYDKEKLAHLVPDDGWYTPTIFHQAMKYMLFGDPTLPAGPAN
jgi:hypothetical protein